MDAFLRQDSVPEIMHLLAAADWNMNLQCRYLRGVRVALDSQATVVKQQFFFCSWHVMCDLFYWKWPFSDIPKSLTVTLGSTCCDVFFLRLKMKSSGKDA